MVTLDERELRIALAKLDAAARLGGATSIATQTDLKPDEVPALAAIVDQLWELFYPAYVFDGSLDADHK